MAGARGLGEPERRQHEHRLKRHARCATSPQGAQVHSVRRSAGHSTKLWLVRNFLGASEASAVYGRPGDGKSVFVQDLGLHVAAGRPWHGRQVQQGAVVYVALERRQLVERRAIAFRLKHDLHDLPFAIVGGVHDFRNPRTAAQLADIAVEVEQVTGHEVVLITIDTLSRALCGGDENSPTDMGAVVRSSGVLQDRTRSHVMWVHHTPIDGSERMRGHGALLGAMDTTLHVARAGTVRTATVNKANDSEEGEQIAFALESVTIGKDEDGNETTAPVIIAIDQPPCLPRTSAARLPKAAQTALRALGEAISEQGNVPPASNHIPGNVRIVSVSV